MNQNSVQEYAVHDMINAGTINNETIHFQLIKSQCSIQHIKYGSLFHDTVMPR